EMLLSGLLGADFSLAVPFGDVAHGWIRFAVDVANLIVVAAIAYAFYRRLVIKPRFIPANMDAMLILGAIMTLCLTHYGHHAWRMAAEGALDPAMPVSATFGRLVNLFEIEGDALRSNVDAGWARTASEVHWWGHMLIIL